MVSPSWQLAGDIRRSLQIARKCRAPELLPRHVIQSTLEEATTAREVLADMGIDASQVAANIAAIVFHGEEYVAPEIDWSSPRRNGIPKTDWSAEEMANMMQTDPELEKNKVAPSSEFKHLYVTARSLALSDSSFRVNTRHVLHAALMLLNDPVLQQAFEKSGLTLAAYNRASSEFRGRPEL